jgi:hypothetical protein
MNSVTGESGPVNIGRPRPAISHEVPGRVERPGPVTPVGLEGARAPRGGVAFAIFCFLKKKIHIFIFPVRRRARAENLVNQQCRFKSSQCRMDPLGTDSCGGTVPWNLRCLTDPCGIKIQI